MQSRFREYAYKKPLLLSALYDTFEKLGWKLLSANSDAGIVQVVERKTGVPLCIRVCPKQAGRQAVSVELACGTSAGREEELEEIFTRMFATLEQLMQEALSQKPPQNGWEN